jgi:hypothetical protein
MLCLCHRDVQKTQVTRTFATASYDSQYNYRMYNSSNTVNLQKIQSNHYGEL